MLLNYSHLGFAGTGRRISVVTQSFSIPQDVPEVKKHDIQMFPGGSDCKESSCRVGDMGRSPGEGNDNPLLCYVQMQLFLNAGFLTIWFTTLIRKDINNSILELRALIILHYTTKLELISVTLLLNKMPTQMTSLAGLTQVTCSQPSSLFNT